MIIDARGVIHLNFFPFVYIWIDDVVDEEIEVYDDDGLLMYRNWDLEDSLYENFNTTAYDSSM